MTMPMTASHSVLSRSSGGCLVSVDGRELPLRAAALAASARGGLAAVRLAQTFHNPYPVPLTVAYALALPPESAIAGFTFRVGEETIEGEIDLRRRARERFEEALIEGRSAALLEEDRSTVFRQEVGNIPPGSEVRIEVAVDQRLAWTESGWEWRFPTVVAPRYLGASGRVADAERLTQQMADRPSGPRLELSLELRDALAGGDPTSPSHALEVEHPGGATAVRLAADSPAALDRDVVVRWPVARPEVGMSLDPARPPLAHPRGGEAHALLTLVPPGSAEPTGQTARDLIVLLDTSGSMEGRPLDQAKAVVRALIESLDDDDQLELIEFSSTARRFRDRPARATPAVRNAARGWLAGVAAGGATEMRSAIVAALAGLREGAQRQVVVVTDGLIGFENEVIATILDGLPAASRLHTVAVGPAPNRSLTGPAARAGRGIEVVIGLDEPPQPAAQRLVAATACPVVVDLVVEGNALLAAPARLPDLFAGRPALLALRLATKGGSLRVRGRTAEGPWCRTVKVPALEPGAGPAAVSRLTAREAVDDLEMALAARPSQRSELEASIERLGLDFQIATRLTSWLAVSAARTVDPREPVRREVVPQQLPYGMSVQGLGLRFARRGRATKPPLAMAQLRHDRDVRYLSDEVPSMDDESTSISDESMRFEQRVFSTMGPPPLPSRSDSAPAAPAKGRGRTLIGRPLVEDAQRLVLTIEVDASLDWQPGARVRVHLEDGRTALVEVIAHTTTRPGPVTAGQVIRLALLPVAGTIVRVTVGVGLEIRVERG